MREYIRRRVLEITDHILETQATVRQTARLFNVSKSTVHKDVTERLPSIDKQLAKSKEDSGSEQGGKTSQGGW